MDPSDDAERAPNDFELESSVRFNAAAFGMMVAAGGVLAAGAFFDRAGRARMMEASFAKGTWYPDWEGIDPEPAGDPPACVEPDGGGGIRLAGGARAAEPGDLLFVERPVFSIRGLALAVVGGGGGGGPGDVGADGEPDPCRLAAQLLADWRPAAHLAHVLPPGQPGASSAPAAGGADESCGWARSSAHRPADRRAICRALGASLAASRVHPDVGARDVACHALAPRILRPDAGSSGAPAPNVRLVALRGPELAIRAEALCRIAPGETLVAGAIERGGEAEGADAAAEEAIAEAVARIRIASIE